MNAARFQAADPISISYYRGGTRWRARERVGLARYTYVIARAR